MDLQKPEILSETPRLSSRPLRTRWVLFIASVPLFGVLAAFGTAPDTITRPVPTERIDEEVPLAWAPVAGGEPRFWHEEIVRRGDTVAALLARAQVADPAAVEFLRRSKDAKPLFQLAPGRGVQALTTETGHLLELRYRHGSEKELVIQREGDGFTVRAEPFTLERGLVMKSGYVRNSLFTATDEAGVPDAVSNQLARIFSSDIDFHRNIKNGDRFTVVYEAFYRSGEMVRVGRLVAAEFVNDGKSHQAVWFEGERGRGAYYTPAGKSLKKSFLRSPIEFSRVSSGFSESRLHPVLQYSRAHQGVDYAAPIGTKVLATSDGTISFAGRQRGYGNVVIVEHRDGRSTLYAHLNDFAEGLREGQRVEQGEVIGYVGMTGLATGPHLHYEYRVGGDAVDPMTLAAGDGFLLTPERRAAFDAEAGPLALRLALLRDTNLARLD